MGVDEELATRLRRARGWARAGGVPAAARGVVDEEDIVQDVALRVLRLRGAPGTVPDAYFRAAVRNRVHDVRRSCAARGREVADPPPGARERAEPAPTPLDSAICLEQARRREALRLGVLERRSPREIAERLRLGSPDAARMRIRRALERLGRAAGPEARMAGNVRKSSASGVAPPARRVHPGPVMPEFRTEQPPNGAGPRRLAVLLIPDVHLLDMSGPVQAFHDAAELGGAYALRYCAERPEVRTAQGLTLSALEPLPDPAEIDRILVPGTRSARLDRLQVPIPWLREAAAAGVEIASVCSGAFTLARAGLLDGRVCTTHWKVAERLREEHPRADVRENRLFVRDGKIVTSAGVASGIDMALALIEEDHGPLVAARVAREMVVWLRRDGRRAQISAYLDHRAHLHPGVHRVQDWIVAHPELRPTLDELAERAGVSARHLTRVFREATGVTPKAFMNRVKLEIAERLLHDPNRTLETIAEECGFQDPRQLRRLWKRRHGMSPSRSRALRDDPRDRPTPAGPSSRPPEPRLPDPGGALR